MYILSKNGMSIVNTELVNLVVVKTSSGAVLKAVGNIGEVVLETANSEHDAQQELQKIFDILESSGAHTYKMFAPNTSDQYIVGDNYEM
jgi:hypothetical protein